MKKCAPPNTTWKDLSIQEKINDMNDDLMTVLESYMDELDTDQLFYNALKFMTTTLYDCAENHQHAFKVLKISMDDGIKNYMDKKEH